jgi:hypothetical protein
MFRKQVLRGIEDLLDRFGALLGLFRGAAGLDLLVHAQGLQTLACSRQGARSRKP